MALRQALPGDTLLVIHEFVARSPDELSLAKGDKIELIERDDDFGDGWFLGRHVQNGATGLFPEVYTTPAPKAALLPPGTPGNGQMKQPLLSPMPPPKDAQALPGAPMPTSSIFNNGKSTGTPPSGLVGSSFMSPNQPPEFIQAPPQYHPAVTVTGYTRGSAQNSTVIDETMNVIDEHITSMHKPSLGVLGGNDRRPSNDSGSQYSTHFGRRLSSLNGGEQEEDEDPAMTRERVMAWSPADVAQYLEKAGVEKNHCEVFQEEEFSGEVLLGLDQSAILLQELRLGSIGRRMKTWAKIRALQEEVKNAPSAQKRVLDRSSIAPPGSASNRHSSHAMPPPKSPSPALVDSMTTRLQSPIQLEFRQPSPQMGYPNQSVGTPTQRPSAAEIRGLAHSRQSSIDPIPGTATRGYNAFEQPSHGKQASLDQSWTMGNKGTSQERTWPVIPRQTSPTRISRPASAVHLHSVSTDRHAFERPISTITDADTGYTSGGEGETKRQKGLLKKADSADQGRQGPERKRSSTLFWRGSRPPSPEKRPQSVSNVRTISEPLLDVGSPTVTKLAYDTEKPRGDRVSGTQTPISESPAMENQAMMDLRKGLRTISDAITGRDKGVVQIPVEKVSQSAQGDTSLPDTPTLAGSSTPSINSRSIDLDDANKSEFSTPALPQNAAAPRKKPKQATSAYIRGLEKKSPQEQMIGCDYSGWMKKKSSSLMTMWKPRLFVLRGRRLSYYYSENDKEEKGLIDISNHRVLPADNDFITGLHATLTGITSSSSPSISSSSTYFNSKHASSPSSAAESPMSITASRTTAVSAATPMKGDNQTFIFKLVPPRSGLSKAVNFTKPTVHYFAVPSLAEGRLWMAALMKATIDKDETKQVVTTYQQKTISLEKARARRERPPGLKEVDERDENEGDEEELDDGNEAQEAALAGAQEEETNGHSVMEDARKSSEMESPASSQPGVLENQEREPAHHQPNASQSMSFVSSLQGQTATVDTSNSTPSAGTGGSFRKWSFSSSRKGSVGKADGQGQGLGIQGTAPAPGPMARDVGTW